MKRKSFFIVTSLASLSLIVAFSINGSYSENLSVRATDDDYNLVLDSSNRPTIDTTNHVGTLTVNDYVTLSYTNVASTQSAEKHITLDAGGTISKTLESNGLISIQAVFDGDLSITTGYTLDEMDYVFELTSGIATFIKGNYFIISTTEYADVNSVSIKYDCETASVPENTYIEDYILHYSEEDKGGYYAADEFSKAFEKQTGIALPLESGTAYNSNNNYIHFQTDSSFSGRYVIERNKNVINLISYDAVGLLEACKSFTNRLESDSTPLNSWYKTPVESTYISKEKVSMMTFNVRVADDGTRPNGDTANIANRAPRVLACIKTHMPDTLGIQEANDNWVSRLKADLQPQYGFIGYGRDANYKGEGTGIFYNRDKVTLLEGGTKWLSDTPDVAGSGFEGCQYKRIFTYGIFQRHSDNYIYMHINTHLDLNAELRKKDVGVFDAFANNYAEDMPIFVTGDYNAQKGVEGDAIDYMLNDLDYIDVIDEALDVTEYHTFSQDGYSDPGNQIVIDFLMKKNRGLYFTKYLVDTARYSGDGVEAPQVTSDHYPIYFEAIPYDPIDEFTYENLEEAVEIDNGFIHYDKNYSLVSHKSQFKNRSTVLANDSASSNFSQVNGAVNHTGYTSLTGGLELTYAFESSVAGKADLALTLANARTVAAGTTLKDNITIRLNGQEIDLGSAKLRCTDIRQLYEWEILALRNVDIKEGRNELSITKAKAGAYMPDHLLLEVFSDTTVTPLKGEQTTDEIDLTNKLILGSTEITVGEFNIVYPNLKAVVTTSGTTKTLTITAKDATNTVINMDGPINFSAYANVFIAGTGDITFYYPGGGDGFEKVKNLTIEEGAGLYFDKASRQGTGMKNQKGTVTVNGTLSFNNFNYGFGSWDAADAFNKIQVNEKGTLNISNCAVGVYTTKNYNNSIVSSGTINISTANDCLYDPYVLNCTFTGNSKTTLTSNVGNAMYLGSSSYVYVQDNSSLTVNAGNAVAYGLGKFIVGNGTDENATTCNATLDLNTKGSAGTGNGTASDGNAFGIAKNGTVVFNTLGKVTITETVSELGKSPRTAIRFNGGTAKLVIKCADMTINNFNYCFGSWSNAFAEGYKLVYEFEGQFNKLKYANTPAIYCTSSGYKDLFTGLNTTNCENLTA